MERIFCPCAFTYQNKGDGLLVGALLEALRARYGNRTHITMASLHPDVDRHWYGVPVGPEPLVRLRRTARPWSARAAVAASWLFVAAAAACGRLPWMGRLLPAEWRSVLEEARAAEAAVGVPGGYLMAPSGNAFWWLSHFCALWACIAVGTPVALAPCSIGPFHRRYRRLARRLLRRVDLIVLRETGSLSFLRALGVDDSRVRIAADMGFYRAERSAPKGTGSGPPRLGMSVRRWDFPGHPDPAGRWDSYLSAMAALADWAVAHLGMRVVFVPQSQETGGDDPMVSGEVLERCLHRASMEVLDRDLSLDELADLYTSFDLLVGTRMHANILAMISGVPVVAVAYEVKTRGIMQQLGLERYVVDISTIRERELVGLVEEAWSRREELRAHLRRELPALRRRSVEWLEDLDRLSAPRSSTESR